MYILVLKNMLKLLEKIINIEKSQTGGKKSNTPTPASTIRKSCLGGTQLTHSSVVKGIMTSEPRKDHPQVLRVKGCDCQAGTWNCASPECNQNSLHFILCPFPFHPVVHHMCLWHCLNCLQHLQTTYFATQSEVVKAIGHWPWREAHHLNWWSILFTCRRRKLWSARCKCHCNIGECQPHLHLRKLGSHMTELRQDVAVTRGASYYYYLSCLPQLHTKATKDKGGQMSNAQNWGSLVSNTSTRRLLHVTGTSHWIRRIPWIYAFGRQAPRKLYMS